MPIKTVTLTVPDPDQPLSELTKEEMLAAFKDQAAVVSRLDTHRRKLHARLEAQDQRTKARSMLDRLSAQEQEALKIELGLK